ncbi:MAG: FAD-binding oxidoreductase [Gammaproteobacteria bacterium]|nr:FAD-binding oxidoreductase [Gammaproteobacteria bacterium]
MKPSLTIIGGGIAGLSCAARATADCDVTVLEAEMQPGYHSSGRSAAVYIEAFMNETVHALSLESSDYFRAHGAKPVGDVTISDAEHSAELDEFLTTWQPLCPDLREADPAEILAQVPILRPEKVQRAVIDPNALSLDAHGLLDGFRRELTEAGGRIINNARVDRIERGPAGWTIGFGNDSVSADVIVNAAGAWGDELAVLAGVAPLGLQPLRRTALLIDLERDVAAWPLIHRVEGGLYFKPEAGVLLVSLADENPSPPCDAQPEELDVAMIVERFQELTSVEVRRLNQTWAGLRTFLPDRLPAVGYDPAVPDFFWLVGQGGSGMQTAPALGRVAADLLAGRSSRFADVLSPARAFD